MASLKRFFSFFYQYSSIPKSIHLRAVRWQNWTKSIKMHSHEGISLAIRFAQEVTRGFGISWGMRHNVRTYHQTNDIDKYSADQCRKEKKHPTKSVDSSFRSFCLALVTRNILGYSLFWDGIQNGFSFRDSFERWNFSGKWSSCANKYQQRDKIRFVGVYWSVEKNILTEFATKS